MEQHVEIKTKNDVFAKASDFVIEHQSTDVFVQFYKLTDQILGEGAYGRVQVCIQNSSKERRAVKIIDLINMSQQDKIRLKYEIDILKNLNHPNIVRLYEVFESKKWIYLVTELCEGKELFDEIIQRKKFTELEAAIVTKQILQAISYCHENRVAHRDLKPENILIDSKQKGAIKVIDFGTSHVYDESNHEMHHTYGTAYYIAPEVLEGKYTEKCDLWSIGVILYIMLSGRPPFKGNNDREILKKVMVGKYTLDGELWQKRSEAVKTMIQALLEKDPQKRMTAKQALDHPWIQQKVHQTFDVQIAKDAFDNLRDFRAEAKLKQAAITFMVTHLSTKKEQAELRKTFNQFDINGDGKIEEEEFINAYKKVYPHMDQETVVSEAKQFFKAADVDKNGSIDFGEWCAATINKRGLLNESNLKATFQLFDKDGGGTISAEEVAVILGHNMSKDKTVWSEIIKEVDLNGDGLIDFNEFKIMMSKFLEDKKN